jgi:hypothetical protein
MKRIAIALAVAGATAGAIKRVRSFNEGAKEPIHIRSDKHTPVAPPPLSEYATNVLKHYCGEIHDKGDLCVEDLYLPDVIVSGFQPTMSPYTLTAPQAQIKELEGTIKEMRREAVERAADLRKTTAESKARAEQLASVRKHLEAAKNALEVKYPKQLPYRGDIP